MKWFSDRCTSHRKSVTLLASDALTKSEQVEVEKHLTECADCQEYYAETRLAVAPLVNWEERFASIEPNKAQQIRWAKAIKAAGESKLAHSVLPVFVLQVLWNELIWPVRRIWAGLAAAWVVIVIANLNLSDSPPATIAKDARPASDMFLALREQERVLAELVGRAEPQVAEPPKRFVPQPRSDARKVWMMG